MRGLNLGMGGSDPPPLRNGADEEWIVGEGKRNAA